MATNQRIGRTTCAFLLSMRNGTWPLSLPESQVLWLRLTSIAMSAPELPAPTSENVALAQL